jgi:hypothetical protein
MAIKNLLRIPVTKTVSSELLFALIVGLANEYYIVVVKGTIEKTRIRGSFVDYRVN